MKDVYLVRSLVAVDSVEYPVLSVHNNEESATKAGIKHLRNFLKEGNAGGSHENSRKSFRHIEIGRHEGILIPLEGVEEDACIVNMLIGIYNHNEDIDTDNSNKIVKLDDKINTRISDTEIVLIDKREVEGDEE